MAIIQRPAKQGGATTYQGKVALGYTKILASEADADLDTIYAAWNGGVETVNLRDYSVTNVKLATDSVDARVLAPSAVVIDTIAPGTVRGTPNAGGITRELAKASIWGGDDLIDGSVTRPKIATGAVFGGFAGYQQQIALGSIWGATDISAGSITRTELAKNAAIRTEASAQCPTTFTCQPYVWTRFVTLPAMALSGGFFQLTCMHGLHAYYGGSGEWYVTMASTTGEALTIHSQVGSSGGGFYPLPTFTWIGANITNASAVFYIDVFATRDTLMTAPQAGQAGWAWAIEWS
jgi:hypothetical protein